MDWYRNIFNRGSKKKNVNRLLNLRSTRFRQLVRNYGRILDLIGDAAEKQAGDYILDGQYTVSLSEVVIDLAEAIIFDLNVLTGERYDSFYDLLDRFRLEIRDIVNVEDEREESPDAELVPTEWARVTATALDPNRLAKAIARSELLYRRVGQVACRGVAAGPVFNVETEDRADRFPQGAVMVALDIEPDDELIRLMRQASAILTDFGEPAADTAKLAREFRVPTIVGLGDASKRLVTGTEVTVDADENTVYAGIVPELLEYYEAERLNQDEEPEYRTLRRLRRFMFSLTFDEDTGRNAALDDCKTLHDLVHLAHELAGEAQFELIAEITDRKTASGELTTVVGIPFRVIDVGGGLMEAGHRTDGPNRDEVSSLPLRVFVRGMDQVSRQRSQPFASRDAQAVVTATITEEHSNILVQQPNGFDIVDSMIGESKESNHIYCRFAAAVDANGTNFVRGAVTREILSRLDFAAAQTGKATTAWLSGVPRADMEARLEIVGRLAASLLEPDTTDWASTSKNDFVGKFMAQQV